MVGEAAVHCVEQECGVLAFVNFLGKEGGHAVGKVEGYLEVGIISFVLHQELEVVRLDVNFRNFAGLCGLGSGTAFVNPLLNLAQTGIQAHGEGVFTANFHAVVLRRVMTCRNLYRSFVAIVCGAEVHQRGAAVSDIVYIGAGIGDTFNKIVVNLLAGNAAVAAHKDLIGVKKRRQEVTHLVSGFLVKIYIVDTADVISVKCSHNIM